MKIFFVMLLISIAALGQAMKCDSNKSKSDRIRDCRLLLKQAYKDTLKKDQGYLNAQLALVSYKVAKLIFDKDLGNSSSEPLKNLSQNLLSSELLDNLNSNSDNIRTDLNTLYFENQNEQVNNENIALEIDSTYEDLDDFQFSKIISQLREKNDYFSQEDLSSLWFVSAVNESVNNKKSNIVSNAVKRILDYNKELSQVEKEKQLVKNIALSKLKVKGELYKIKNDVFQAHKCDCVGDYQQESNSQNNSILLSCEQAEEQLIEDDFISGLHEILLKTPAQAVFNDQLPLRFQPKSVNSQDVRMLQDQLNTDDFSNRERIIQFYKTGLYENKGDCQSFTVVDKKNQTTSVYSIDGNKIFETNAIMAKPRSGSNQVVFNPDSELREFNNGSYSRSTSAGVFYNILDLDPIERRARKYDDEFDDRVFVLGTRSRNKSGEYEYDDKITIALHGVPIKDYVSNANERLASFDGGNRNLSTGCVNIEGYAFDMVNNLSQNHCPMYILPEDDKNYFHIKNRELSFSTSINERKEDKESPMRCSGEVVIGPNGKPICNGQWTQDPNNHNRYYYSPLSHKQTIRDYRVGESKVKVVDDLMKNKDQLIREITKEQIDEEDFTDLAAMTYALSVGENNFKTMDTFKDLYNAYYKLKENQGINFERMSVEDKRLTILGYYQDPSGFRKDQGNTYAPVITKRSVSENIQLSSRVRFIYDQ